MEKKLSKVTLKQLPNPDNPNLGIKYVGAITYATPLEGKDGKIITGLDEDAYAVNIIEDKEKREKIKKEIKLERESLERLLGVDLKPSSQFWKEFYVSLGDELPIEEVNPKSRLYLRFLIANRYVAPSLEEAENNEEYANAQFYVCREEEEVNRQVDREMEEDKASGILLNTYENNKNKLGAIASNLFGYDAKETLTAKQQYSKLKEFITAPDPKQRKKNIKIFVETSEKSVEQLAIKIVLDKAVKKKIVTSRGGIYRRDTEVYGDSYEEALIYLVDPANAVEAKYLTREVGI